MVMKLSWLVPDQLILFYSCGDLTIEEFYKSQEQIVTLLDKSRSPVVHVFVDETLVTSIPTSVIKLRDATSWIRKPQVGWVVSYGRDDAYGNFVTTLIAQMSRLRYRRLKDYAEAAEFLQSQDSKLPDLMQCQVRHH